MFICVVLLRWNAQEGLGRPMPEVPREYLQRCLFIWGMQSMPSRQQIARGLYIAEQLHVWRWSSGQFEWEPCPVNLGKKVCLAMFSPENLFDFSRVVKLWSSVQKSCITRNLEQSKEVRMSKGRSQVLRHLREMPHLFLDCTRPGSEVHSASPLPNYTRLGNESRAYKCLPPASRCNANLSDPLSQVKGVCNEGFCRQYIDVSIFWCFMDIV